MIFKYWMLNGEKVIEEVQEFVGLSSSCFLLHLCHQFIFVNCFVCAVYFRSWSR